MCWEFFPVLTNPLYKASQNNCEAFFMLYYFVLYKPYRVLSQFTTALPQQTLSHICKVPKNVYPVGRLDYESEGLLILTNDAALNNRLLHPKNAHEREYWVQVEGIPSKEAIQQLQKGVVISVNNKPYTTQPCKVSLFKEEPCVPLREPPIRERKHIPTAWLQLILHEGKNRQVRKMTAKVGFPTLRLIRYRIEELTIENMQPGDIKKISKEAIYKSLFH